MIVGTTKVEVSDLVKHTKSVDDFRNYCIHLVPDKYRHLQAVVNNQIYICCLCLRKCDAVAWDTKKEILRKCMQDIRIVGCTNELIDFDDILMYVGR